MVEKEGLFEIEKWISERQVPKGKWRKKDYRDRKTEQYVFDIPTLETLYKFAQKGIITALGGPISRGKESVIFHALGAEEKELAIKMYKVNTATFNAMIDYIVGDPRFKGIKKDHRSIIFAWARKEYKNLSRALEAGVRVPTPLACDRNVLIMEFIGKEGIAAPRLRDVPPEVLAVEIGLEALFLQIVAAMKTLYEDAGLVHADLSEFNILLKGYVERELASSANADAAPEVVPLLIDMGQATLLDHPNAEAFLRRDAQNISAYFAKLGLAHTEEEILRRVKGGK
jgi:RIO kinase 1